MEKWNVYKMLGKEPFAMPPFGKSRRMKDRVKMELGNISCMLENCSAYYTRGADKSVARPTSRCRRTESIVSLERRGCSCAELQVFSCYRG
jgi:hypothetical protein